MSLAPTSTLPAGSRLWTTPDSFAQATAQARHLADSHAGAAALLTGFRGVNLSTAWELTSTMALDFQTHHPQGMAVTEDRIFLSSVQVREPTVQLPMPRGRYDRTAGTGIGHLFVLDRKGNLETGIVLGEGKMYHPGGIDVDGTNVWVPVAQYRPDSSSVVYRVDAETLEVHRQFEVDDHCGGIIMNKQNGHLVGNTWGSRHFIEWNLLGKQLGTWQNPSLFLDYQDCQYAGDSTMLCRRHEPATGAGRGEAWPPATSWAGWRWSTYAATRSCTSCPSRSGLPRGHVVTRNAFTMDAVGGRLTMRVAPDNGDEDRGTEIFTYEAAFCFA